jgi:hypothetical protein
MEAASLGINRREAAPAHPSNANSMYKSAATNVRAISRIAALWQPCVSSIRPASCPGASLQNRATLW